MVKLTAIQLSSLPDVDKNLENIRSQLKALPKNNQPHIVVLPECCLFFGAKDSDQLSLAKNNELARNMHRELSMLAHEFDVYLVAGSIPVMSVDEGKFTNSCFVFSPAGDQLAKYNKIHLFDVNVNDSAKQYAESTLTYAGNQVVVVSLAGIKVGLTICYDLRFPELFRQLRELGANVITVPSAFTRVTGQAHWQTLLQARAIENQVYLIGAGQVGTHNNGRETWGHSMIVSPWGEILARKESGQGSITADYVPEEIANIRAAMPVQQHNKFTTKLNK